MHLDLVNVDITQQISALYFCSQFHQTLDKITKNSRLLSSSAHSHVIFWSKSEPYIDIGFVNICEEIIKLIFIYLIQFCTRVNFSNYSHFEFLNFQIIYILVKTF